MNIPTRDLIQRSKIAKASKCKEKEGGNPHRRAIATKRREERLESREFTIGRVSSHSSVALGGLGTVGAAANADLCREVDRLFLDRGDDAAGAGTAPAGGTGCK